MGTSSTTTDNDFLALVKEDQEKLDQAVKEAHDAAKRIKDQEEANYRMLVYALRGKVIVFTGWLESEDMFGQDGFEMYDSRDRLQDQRLVVTGVFLTEERPRISDQKTPIIYATREQSHLEHRLGGRVSFRLLEAQKIEIVE
jgi:hypothetical protein